MNGFFLKSYGVIRYFLYGILLFGTFKIPAQTIEAISDSIVLTASRISNDSRVQIDSINAQAAYYLKKKPSLTWLLAEHSLDMANEVEYKKGRAISHYFLGSSQVYEKNAIALEHLLESYKLAVEIQDISLQASTMLSISTVYHGMNQNENAINSAKKAEEIGEMIDDLKLLSRVHTNLASFYYNDEDISLALFHSKKALALKKELKDNYGIRLNYLILGTILSENDSTLDEGIWSLKKARNLSRDDPVMLNDVMANMIWAYSQKQAYDLCLSYLDSALMGNDSINNKYTRHAIHRLGKEVYLEIGDFENAYIHAAFEYEMDNELRGKEVEGRFKILELENENYVKQKQILLLEKSRSEANLKFLYAIALACLLLLLIGVLFKNDRLKKRLLEDLKSKQIEIEEKSHLLEIKNKETEQFAYVASHDLKAPLNTIISCINMVRDEIDLKLDGQSQQMATFISSSANRMKDMIDSLLEHGKLGSDIEFEEVDLNKLIYHLRQDLSKQIQETGATLKVNYLPKVKGSSVELSLLFQNLITNGIKFSSNNQSPEISITYRSLKNIKRHQFSIRDNGVGIPEKRQEKVFTLFERAHGKEYEGSGIGLAHCQKIVKLHKGSIWLDSQVGEGTTFHFLLPMKDWKKTDNMQNEDLMI